MSRLQPFWRPAGTLPLAALATLCLLPSAHAGDLPSSQPPVFDPLTMHVATEDHGDHGKIPAGVFGAGMIGQGRFMLDYTPMFMHMANNYIGSSQVPAAAILNTSTPMPVTMMGMTMDKYRIVPTSMDTQSHMLHAMYGVTDWLNVMVMGSYQEKSMTMTTYNPKGTGIVGTSSASTSGFGDTTVTTLWRLYQDPIHHVHLNLGLSLPSGSTTENISMLSPMGTYMTMRANYGMQLGTGTVDFLPGITYTGHWNQWSWGAAYRGRVALDNNSEGYHYGYQHELTGWGGYTWIPGITTTARVAGSIQDVIHGSDPMISGLMQGTNPLFYGGKRLDLFGGVEVDAGRFGLANTHLALEGGGPVYQDLNGPQLGHDWQLNVAVRVGF